MAKRAQRPEALTQIADGPFDFALFPASGHIAGARRESIQLGECEQTRMEPDEIAIAFGNGRRQVVVEALARDTAKEAERVDMATQERLERLAVRELDIKQPAVAFDHAKSVELALVAAVVERVEVRPIDFEPFA